jgi:8-oxo-dGTP pyrophosphatase MutT (NUDIX family)
MSFAEFMRGKYDPTNTEYVERLIGNMTIAEQAMISTESFEGIWKTLWGDEHLSGDYAPSQAKFNQISREQLVKANPSSYEEPEWGFPKGRRIRGETDVDCAIREFGEETNIHRDAYVVLKNIRLEETFEGLNGIAYRHVYFVALLKNPEMINLTQRFTPMQRREISGIAWKTFSECEQLVRPHHVQRKSMIQELRGVIDTFETV